MKRLLLAAAFFAVVAAFPASAAAQAQAGVKAGVNFAKLSETDEFDSQSQRIGLIGGVWVRVPATNAFSFQVEALFSEKGLKGDETFDGVPVSMNIRIRYLEVPLLAHFNLGAAGSTGRFYVIAGAAPAFKIGDGHITLKAEGEEVSENFEEFTGEKLKSFDLGLVAGAGIEFGRGLVEARYTHGLLDVGEGEDAPKNRVFSVLAGFRFR